MRLGALRVYYAASFGALGAYLPFFPAWLEARGIAGATMGLVAALLPAASLVAPVAFGVVADRLALRGWLLRVACAGAAAPFAALAVFTAAGGELGLAAIVAAVATFAFFRAPMVTLADVLAMEGLAAGGTTYGRVRLWGSAGFLVVASLLPRVVDPRGSVALPAAVAIGLAGALAASFALPSRAAMPPRPVARDVRELVWSPAFGAFLLAALLGQGGHAAYDLCFSLHLVALGGTPELAGGAWALGVLAEVVLLAALRPRGGSTIGAPAWLPFAYAGAAARWLLVASIPSPWLLLVLQPLHAISFALAWTSSLAFVQKHAPSHVLSTAQGLFSTASAVGMVLAMVGWGSLYRSAGGAVVFAAAAVPSALACLVMWVALSRSRNPSRGGSADPDGN